jgi:drug/metabolite transporter (DMT)-like permease
MPAGAVLGIATAISWGSADFLARFATRAVGSARALFWMQLFGAVLVTALLLLAHDWGHLFDHSGLQPWFWGISAGGINTFAMFALYRAFETGKLSLVGPVSASYPALTVILSILSGEHLSSLHWAGVVAALAGVLVVATGEPGSAPSPVRPRSTAGLFWAIAASLSFGLLFWLLGIRMIPRTGALATVWLIRLTGSVLTFLFLLITRQPLRISRRQTLGQLWGMGFLDTGAFALSNLAMKLVQVSIVSVLGSLYGAVTVALAALFLKERIAPLQWLGIAAIFLGVTLVNL